MTSPLSVAADALVAEAESHDADAIRMTARTMAHTYGWTWDGSGWAEPGNEKPAE